MTRRTLSASVALVSRCWTSMISAFHNVQARPRAHVASSSGSTERNAARLAASKNVQAM